MLKYFCDKCGCEIKYHPVDGYSFVKSTFLSLYGGGPHLVDSPVQIYCEDCLDKIKEFLGIKNAK